MFFHDKIKDSDQVLEKDFSNTSQEDRTKGSNPVIVAELKGGLGNQMFQYATGFSVAKKTGQKFYFTTDWLESHVDIDAPRVFELECFNISSQSKKLNSFKDKTDKITIKNFKKKKISRYQESSLRFDKEIFSVRDVILDGFWQSEKYFKDIRKSILSEFTFNDLPKAKNAEVAKKIQSSACPVSLHVRRGDYVKNRATNQVHGVTDLAYYEKAIAAISKHYDNIELFIFSDDIAWCRENLSIGHSYHFVEGNKKGSQDMQLMSLCQHNIIANSSFSWWGAWLNNNPNKIVVAPVEWFRDSSLDSKDIVPKDWIRI